MKKYLLSVLIVLSACSVNKNYDLSLQKWIGQSEYSLLTQWGQPNNVIGLDANSYIYVYEKISDTPFDDNKYPYEGELDYQYSAGPKYGYSQIQQIYYCKTMFTIRNQVVINYSFIGDDCV